MAKYYKMPAAAHGFPTDILIQHRTHWTIVGPGGEPTDSRGRIPEDLLIRLEEISRDEADQVIAGRLGSLRASQAMSDPKKRLTTGQDVAAPRHSARWIATVVACCVVGLVVLVFGLSFLFMGVGYGGAGFDLSALFRGDGDTNTTEPLSNEEKLDGYLQILQANPEDTTTMLAVATLYEDMYKAGEGDGTEYLVKAAAFMENAVDVDPSLKEVYMRLANLYMSQEFNNNEAAVAVLNKAASADPANPDVFLKLGIAQQSLGNKSAAVLAWQKYLELDPNGDMADVVKERLEELAPTTITP